MCCSPWGFRVRQDLATQQQLIFISILMAYTFKYCFLSVNHGKVIFILDQGERNTFFIFKSKQPLLKAVVLTQLCKATVIIPYLFKKRDASYRLGFYEFGGILFYFVWREARYISCVIRLIHVALIIPKVCPHMILFSK